MKTNLHYVFFISFFLLTFSVFSQQNYWIEAVFKDQAQGISLKNLDDSNYKTYQLNIVALKEKLVGVPVRGQFSGKSNTIISFPNEYGKLENFRIIETSVLSDELSVRYPNIKTYLGFSVDNPGTRIRFSVTPLGINAMTSYLNKSTSFLSPISKHSNGQYLTYNRNAKINASKSFECLTEDTFVPKREHIVSTTNRDANDQLLRTLRIAISTTGEYTNFWDDGNAGNGNAQEDALAQVVSTLNRVNEVFEVDMAVTFTLVSGTELLYPDATTDPYDSSLNSELQSTLTSEVGEANYDIGHLFHFAANDGNAGCIGCVCVDGQKGSGYSSHTFTDNDGGTYMTDFFDVDYVSHEIGHQMGANHTWSFDSEGSGVQSEPGSGTTIMGYAGITGSDDVQDHSDPYFHYHSIDQILDNLINVRTCWTSTAITNNPPVANAGNDYTIPQGTAFILKGVSTDADGGDTHTYTWEQIDNGITTNANFGPTKASGATWRSRPPNTSPNRYMPILSRVIAGQLTETNPLESVNNSTWETVSTVGRDLNFALTVRDRSETNGTGQMPQSSFDTMKVTVDGNSGSFAITSQTTNETWEIGSNQTITWDVANTNMAPINTTNVNILLSIDGGLTFPFTLANNVSNNGSHNVTIPSSTTTTQARIMVEAVNNIYYAMNSANFTIIEVDFVLNASNPLIDICQPDNAVYNFTYNTFGGFSETTVFSANNIPTGATVVFNPTSATINGTAVTMTVSNTGAVNTASYTITVIGTASSVYNVDIILNVFSSTITATTLSSPTDNAENVSTNVQLSWVADDNAQNYLVEVATDSGFTNIVDSATIQTTSFTSTMLGASTQYYWRVTASNQCGTAVPSSVFNFTTQNIICNNVSSTDTPINIPDNNTSGITSVLNIPFLNKVSILDVNVTLNMTHPWVGDLTITLTSPEGTVVTLVSSRSDDGDNYTNTVFDDDATNNIASNSAPYTGLFRPEGNLSSFNSEFSNGNWELKVVDGGPEDIGSLDSWSLEICGSPPLNFSLPITNFNLLIKSETCRNSDNGSLTISAVETLNYTAQITGNGIDISNPFTASTNFNDLAAGNYMVCITVENQPTYEQCFNIVITEPEDLSVISRVDTLNSRLSLELSGGVNYTIDLNGTITNTTANEISLTLLQGINQLKITTDHDCQGVYREAINNSLLTIVFPNPILDGNDLNINTGDTSIKKIDVVLYSILGQSLLSKSLHLNNGKATLDVSSLSTGMYLLVVNTGKEQTNFKVLKK